MTSLRLRPLLAAALAAALALSTIGFAAPRGAFILPATKVLTPESPGVTVYRSAGAEVDASNLSEGYITARYTGGGSARLKLRITKQGGTVYTYDLSTGGSSEVFALTEENGEYTVQIYQNVSGSSYAQLLSQRVQVSLGADTLPFLYPNQYVNFSAESAAVKKAQELAKDAGSELDIIGKVYHYVTQNITYDQQFAQSVESGQVTTYLPDIDAVLESGKGICFDYASLMTAMLRSQGIPSKLVIGYAGQVYHAWISTYVTDVGWVDGVIYFDGTSWKLMDPTFASTSGKAASAFIGDGSNYSKVYTY